VLHVHDQQPPGGAYQDPLPLTGQHHPSQGAFARFLQRLGQHGAGVLRRWTVGKQVQTPAGEEGRIDGGKGHELLQHQSLVARGPELIESSGSTTTYCLGAYS
jgi:hypothetical protein